MRKLEKIIKEVSQGNEITSNEMGFISRFVSRHFNNAFNTNDGVILSKFEVISLCAVKIFYAYKNNPNRTYNFTVNAANTL